MADTRCQSECEVWVRGWLSKKFGQGFTEKNIGLTTGGRFKFDAVSDDGTVLVSISTSRSLMSSGKRGVGKMMKLRGDMLFLALSPKARKIMLFTEPCMYEACLREKAKGRTPLDIEFQHVALPEDLAAKLASSRECSSREVRPIHQAVRLPLAAGSTSSTIGGVNGDG